MSGGQGSGESGRAALTDPRSSEIHELLEVCSLADGAWYEAYPHDCTLVWAAGKPSVRVKYKDFDYGECELFRLEHLYQRRFRRPFSVAEEKDAFEVGEDVVGFARSHDEEKWFDATVAKIAREEGDTLVTVEWRAGMSALVFGAPLSRTLSVKNGEVGRPRKSLSVRKHPVLREWAEALRELSRPKEDFEEVEDRTPEILRDPVVSKILWQPRESWTPSALNARASIDRLSTPSEREVKRSRSPDSECDQPKRIRTSPTRTH